MDEEKIEISKAEYEKLINDQNKLNALESWGVDNWCGYDEAMEELRRLNNNGITK